MNWLEKIGTAVIVGPVIILVLAIILVLPTWWAWNAVMPYVFGLPTINGWQAFAIVLLTSLFKGTTTVKK